MLGTIIGDIAGSRFEWHNYKSKDFELFTYKCHPTDDSIMSLAVANAMLASKEDYSDLAVKVVEQMQSIGRQYPHCGFGGSLPNGLGLSSQHHIIVLAMARQCALVQWALRLAVLKKQYGFRILLQLLRIIIQRESRELRQ